jgi:hypothetical protein
MTFFVGNLVEVEKEHRTGRRDSDGGRAYILAINNDPNGRGTKRPQYDVKYVVGGIVSPNVKRRRISPVIMETTAPATCRNKEWCGRDPNEASVAAV